MTKQHDQNIDAKGVCLATEYMNGLVSFLFYYIDENIYSLMLCRLNIQKNRSKDYEKFNDYGDVLLYEKSFSYNQSALLSLV